MQPVRYFVSLACVRSCAVATLRRATLATWLLPLMYVAASAEPVQLVCPYASGTGANLVTIDYSAKTLSSDVLNPDGSVQLMAQHGLPATITDETVSATWTYGDNHLKMTLNRYSAIMHSEITTGGGFTQGYSKPCTPYKRGQKKF